MALGGYMLQIIPSVLCYTLSRLVSSFRLMGIVTFQLWLPGTACLFRIFRTSELHTVIGFTD